MRLFLLTFLLLPLVATAALPPAAVPLLREVQDDARLVEALEEVFEADEVRRPERVEALESLADARLVPALGYILRQDRESAVRSAAAKALGAYAQPRAQSLLTGVLDDEHENERVRVAAARALGRQGTESAAQSLARVAMDPDVPGAVRQAATDAVYESFPSLAERLGLKPKVAAASGRALGTVVGAASGAYSLALVGALSPSGTVGTVVGAFGGLVLGGVSGSLLSRAYELDEGDALFLASSGIWSVPTGFMAGQLFGGPEGKCENPCLGTALGVHLLSMGGSWMLRDSVSLSALDALEANAAGVAGLLLALGAVGLPAPSDDVRPGLAVLAVLPAASYVAGVAFAEEMKLSWPLAGFALVSLGEGLLVGQLLGSGLIAKEVEEGPLGTLVPNPHRDRQMAAMRWLGLGAGLSGALVASGLWRPTGSDVRIVTSSAVLGHTLGAGLALLAGGEGSSQPAMTTSAIAGLGVATAMGLLTGPLEMELDAGGTTLVAAAAGFATLQGLGWASLIDRRWNIGNERSLGLGLLVGGLGGAAGLVASQAMEVSALDTAWVLTGAVWGGWLAGWGAHVFHGSDTAIMRSVLLGADLGLLVAGLLVSPLLGVDPERLAWTSVFGVGGMTLASMLAVFVAWDSADEARPVSTANLIGTTAGLVIGAVVSGWLVEDAEGPKTSAQGRARTSAGLGPPMVGIAPVVEPGGTRIEGLGASLSWVL